MKTAILHIGAHKTGSTSIQGSLAASKANLRELGINYFNEYERRAQLHALGLRRNQRYVPLNSQHPSSTEITSAGRSALRHLARTVQRSTSRFTILSDEALFRIKSPATLASILYRIFDEVFIVAYVRNPISRYPSAVDQWIRGGRSTSKCTYNANLVPTLGSKLLKYEAAFGREALIVRNFDQSNLEKSSPCADFSMVVSKIANREVSLQEIGIQNASMPACVTYMFLKENDDREAGKQTQTCNWKQQRRKLIAEVRSIKVLGEFKRIQLTDSAPLYEHLCASVYDETEAINERFLSNQIPITVPRGQNKLKRSQIPFEFREWLQGYENLGVEQILRDLAQIINRPYRHDLSGEPRLRGLT